MPNDEAAPRRKKPRPCFDIDDEVEALSKAGLIRGDFQGNPYLTARCYLGRAIAIARNEQFKKDALSIHRAALKKAEKKVRDIAKRLQRVAIEAESLLAISVTMGSGTSDPWEVFERRGHAANIRLPLLSNPRHRSPVSGVAAVKALEAALKVHRDNIPQSTDDAFRPAFIEEMNYCWVRLTAKIPREADEAFAAFVNAAHTTLTVTSPSVLGLPFHIEPWDPDEESARDSQINDPDFDGWGWQIQKTLRRMNRRPAHDRADRYERGFLSPTVDFQPSPARRRLAGTRAEFDEETKRLIEEMLAGGESSRAAAQILLCEFRLAGQELQKRYLDEFDFNPAEALALIGGGDLMSPPSSSP